MSDDNSYAIELGEDTYFDFNNAVGGLNGSQAPQVSELFYNLYLIADSSGSRQTGVYAVASGTTLVLPAGYNKKRLLGVFYSGNKNVIYDFTQENIEKTRKFTFSSSQPNVQIHSSNMDVYEVVALDRVKPHTAKILEATLYISSPSSSMCSLYIRPGGGTEERYSGSTPTTVVEWTRTFTSHLLEIKAARSYNNCIFSYIYTKSVTVDI